MSIAENRRSKGNDRRAISRMNAINDRRGSVAGAKVVVVSREDIAKLSLRELEEEILANSLENN